jgi:outer membrane protein OmpA-like peptidoglycan-associated protein
MAHGHLAIGAFCGALGLVDLAILNLWIAPAAWPGGGLAPIAKPTPPTPTPIAKPTPPTPTPIEEPAPAPIARPTLPTPTPIAKPTPPTPTPIEKPAPPTPTPIAKPTPAARSLTVRFGSSTSVIGPSDAEAIRALARALRRKRFHRIAVEGHTDQRGENDLNQRLSWLRAQAAAAILIEEGIPAGRITARGIGSSRPLDAADTTDAWANNRRVEIRVLRTETER